MFFKPILITLALFRSVLCCNQIHLWKAYIFWNCEFCGDEPSMYVDIEYAEIEKEGDCFNRFERDLFQLQKFYNYQCMLNEEKQKLTIKVQNDNIYGQQYNTHANYNYVIDTSQPNGFVNPPSEHQWEEIIYFQTEKGYCFECVFDDPIWWISHGTQSLEF